MKIKRTLAMLMSLLLVSACLTGCGGTQAPPGEGAAPNAVSASSDEGASALRVAFVCNGNLGDLSFLDSGAQGINRAAADFGFEVKIIETGFDKTRWQPALEDTADEDYDIIIVGTWEMEEPLAAVAPQHPDKNFIIFDTEMDYSDGKNQNVYSISYRYNEESFLAGALAAMVTTSDMPDANPEKSIGFIGGIDSPVINDYLVGFIDGAQYIDPAIKVAHAYVGDFADSTRGKELASAMFDNQKVDIVFAAAGQAGLGAIDAAKDAGLYTIGVDADQAMIFKDSDPAKAEVILTSAVANVGESLYGALKKAAEGTLAWGSAISTGIADGTAELVDNEYYQRNVPEQFRKKVQELKGMVADGQITVKSAIGMDQAELDNIRNNTAP